MLIYIVEDDFTIAKALSHELERHDYQVVIANDFQKITQEVQSLNPNLILLDINLPHHNGYYWCTQIRTFSQVPIIFISSMSESMDQLMALQLGADDYIVKPIDLPLTVAKIEAILRRSYNTVSDYSKQMKFETITLDIGKNMLNFGDKSLDLTHTERLIIESLIQGQGNYVSRDTLLDACWQNDQYIDDNTLAVNISRLRKKLTEINLSQLIETKRNEGYRLNRERLAL
ncbi:response regulator transcription factor [Aerococcaceae bacterium DSM 111176]|nr:response regulator transcription factor [Aerococcaceae bacterium DSM 111176]